MRKLQQRQLLQLADSLQEAVKECRRLYKADDRDSVIGLLSDCQETAVQMGEYIEQLYGESAATVSLLEEYYEQLYTVGVCVADAENKKPGFDSLKQQLQKIAHSIRTELKPDRLEAVFMPYKASMWDALESIWLAMKDDPQCDAYVVPIPYYDKMADGRLGIMHDESGDYPAYVPVMGWREYDLEVRRPDVVFIHNPYDDANLVTSVHPNYFSENLKKSTDLLCYCPYYISTTNTDPMYILSKGVLNADRVFLQSDTLRHQYREVFAQNGLAVGGAKFIASGSPKCDKAILSQREDFQLPEEWRAMLAPSAGAGKKTVLYNTTVTGHLQYDAAYLDKIRATLETFRGRDDIVLWWRPHPLSQGTLASMRPHLLEEYRRIVAGYKAEGFGIYDDTPDPAMALTWTDAYYGDHSAMMASYYCTAKPQMLQNMRGYGHGALLPTCLCKCEEEIYFSDCSVTSLLCLDVESGVAECAVNGHICNFTPYFSMVALGGVLYLAPLAAPGILAYDRERRRPFEIELDEKVAEINPLYDKRYKIIKAFTWKNAVYFVGCSFPAIVRYDTETGCAEYFSKWFKHVKDRGRVIFYDACTIDSRIVAVGESNRVLIFDMETNSYTLKSVPVNTKGFSTIAFDGKHCWLSPLDNGPIFQWDPEGGETRKYDGFPQGVEICQRMFNKSLWAEGWLWLFSCNSNAVVRLETASGEMRLVRRFDSIPLGSANHFCAQRIGDEIFSAVPCGRGLDAYNVFTGEHREILLDDSALPEPPPLLWEMWETIHDTIWHDCGQSTLDRFLDSLVMEDPARADRISELVGKWIAAPDGTAGEAIYRQVKREILGE